MKVDIPALNIKGLDIPELAYLELTPQNVMRILFACRVTEEVEGKAISSVSFISKSAGRQVPTIKFDFKKLMEHTALIRYFVGQLQFVHRKKMSPTATEGCLNYKGEKWITDNKQLFALYFLATGNALLPQLVDEDTRLVFPNLAMHYTAGLHPTYPPSDPRFKFDFDVAKSLKALGAKLPDGLYEYFRERDEENHEKKAFWW